jgi:hypothetical protein
MTLPMLAERAGAENRPVREAGTFRRLAQPPVLLALPASRSHCPAARRKRREADRAPGLPLFRAQPDETAGACASQRPGCVVAAP